MIMRLCIYLILFSISIVCAAQNASLKYNYPDHNPFSSAWGWTIKCDSKLPSNKFLRMTMDYTVGKNKGKMIFMLNGSQKLDKIMFYLLSSDGLPYRLYIQAFINNRYPFTKWFELSAKQPQNFKIYYANNIKLENNKVVSILSNRKKNFFTVRSRGKFSKSLPEAPELEIEITTEIVETQATYLLDTDLKKQIAKLSLKDQYGWLQKECKRRQDLYQQKEATFEDMQLAHLLKLIIRNKLENRKNKPATNI